MARFPTGKIKRGRASLIGGIATGAAVLVLFMAVAHELGHGGPGVILAGLAAAVLVAGWVRLADL